MGVAEIEDEVGEKRNQIRRSLDSSCRLGCLG